MLAAILFSGAQARADFVLSAQSVLSSPPPIGDFTFDRTIDQSGLSLGYTSGVTNFATYVAAAPIHTRNNTPPNFGATFSLPPVNVDYDLGSAFTVQRLAFWNYPFGDSGSVTALEVYTSSAPDFSGAVFAGVFAPLPDGDGNINNVQVFDLTDTGARYVRLRATAVAVPNGTGWSEIAFDAAIIPEPASLATVCPAIAALAAAMRRRARVVVKETI
jgi:hypothetical protein